MAGKPSTFFNMILTLGLITFLSSAGVAYVFEVTKKPRAQAEIAKKINAIRRVVPEFNNNPLEEKYSVQAKDDTLIFYPAKKDGKRVATAVETSSSQGFGGEIRLMVGFLPDGDIYDIAVVDHKETPGLGDKMERGKSGFTSQFRGQDPKSFRLKVTKDGGDVDAITAATISSRAFCGAVQMAYGAFVQEESSL